MTRNAESAWRFGGVVALMLATATPSWPEDGSQEVLTRATQDAGATRTCHLGAGRLDGNLGRADVRVGDPPGALIAQAPGASSAAGTRRPPASSSAPRGSAT